MTPISSVYAMISRWLVAFAILCMALPAQAWIHGGSSGVTPQPPALLLSSSAISVSATVGTTIGAFSVINGVGSYTYTLTSNPGALYSISGANLQVAAALTVGSDPITVQANNGAGGIVNQPFTIVVNPAVTDATPLLLPN